MIIRVNGKMDGSEYRAVLIENLLEVKDWGKSSPINRTMNLSIQTIECVGVSYIFALKWPTERQT